MALLDMQGMESKGGHEGHSGGGGAHSGVSLAFCDSSLSTLLCL